MSATINEYNIGHYINILKINQKLWESKATFMVYVNKDIGIPIMKVTLMKGD